jgi:transposase InsO family protein
MSQRRKFDKEFKVMTVELCLSGKSITEVAAELGLRPELVSRWKREYEQKKGGSFSGHGNRKPSARRVDAQQALTLIKEIHQTSKGRYGSPKITYELRKKGIFISRPRVARIMKNANIRSIVHKRFRVCTTDSKHNYPVAENLLNRNFTPEKTGKAWVSDLTYIRTALGWLYLTVIIDLADRKVVGWSLSQTLNTSQTVIPAWKMAITNRPITTNLIFHSDRGVQYACCEFRDILKAQPLVMQSMSRKANCWDNAVAESFFRTLKSELVYHLKIRPFEIAKIEIFEFIEI